MTAPQPLWAALALVGLRRRSVAVAFLWLSVVLALASLAGMAWMPVMAWGVLGLSLAALWYWAAIREADRHGRWS